MANLGVIEGFYGSFYNIEQRHSLCKFIKERGYNFYIYAPKNDGKLRSHWDVSNDLCRYDSLKDIALNCTKLNLDFGIGLSPLKVTYDYQKEKRKFFLKTVENLCKSTKCSIFSLLFDDVKLQSNDIGQIQNEIISDVMNILPDFVKTFIVCPSYYTFDPLLDKIFGSCPKTYFDDLTEKIDSDVSFFWTGNKVLSPDITKDDLKKANSLFKRKVFLWDNYPVNDGKKISQFLYTKAFNGRFGIEDLTKGHAVNPMNEPTLSQIALLTLPLIYNNLSTSDIEAQRLRYIESLFNENTDTILSFFDEVLKKGLDNLDIDYKTKIIKLCSKYTDSQYTEIKDFLNNVYIFDPNYPDTE